MSIGLTLVFYKRSNTVRFLIIVNIYFHLVFSMIRCCLSINNITAHLWTDKFLPEHNFHHHELKTSVCNTM